MITRAENHTPGPWRVTSRPDGCGGEPDLLAILREYRYQFAALRESLGWREGGGEWIGPFLHGVDDKAEAAIARAEGRED